LVTGRGKPRLRIKTTSSVSAFSQNNSSSVAKLTEVLVKLKNSVHNHDDKRGIGVTRRNDPQSSDRKLIKTYSLYLDFSLFQIDTDTNTENRG